MLTYNCFVLCSGLFWTVLDCSCSQSLAVWSKVMPIAIVLGSGVQPEQPVGEPTSAHADISGAAFIHLPFLTNVMLSPLIFFILILLLLSYYKFNTF